MSEFKNNYAVSFDTYGNIYLNDIPNNETYQLNVNGKNIPYLEKGEYKILNECHNKFGTFSLLDKNTSLKARIKKIQLENNVNYDSDDDYDLDGDNQMLDYYPEDNDHYVNDKSDNDEENQIFDEDLIKHYGDQNSEFKFWSSSPDQSFKINSRENGDIAALYDVFIYDENDNLIFKSVSSENNSIYRIRLFMNGELFFRPIGYTENKYVFELNKYNVLELLKL